MKNIVILNTLTFFYPLIILKWVSCKSLLMKWITLNYYKYSEKARAEAKAVSDLCTFLLCGQKKRCQKKSRRLCLPCYSLLARAERHKLAACGGSDSAPLPDALTASSVSRPWAKAGDWPDGRWKHEIRVETRLIASLPRQNATADDDETQICVPTHHTVIAKMTNYETRRGTSLLPAARRCWC